MTYNEISDGLWDLSLEEMISLNKLVVARVKRERQHRSTQVRGVFKAGDAVKWTGRRGLSAGKIERVKRIKALVVTYSGERWNIPLSMLSFGDDYNR